jgi:transmembrane sensor
MHDRETSAEIYRTAARWVARVDRGSLSEAESADLAAWRAADKRRDGAYVRAHALMTRFDRAGALGSGYDPEKFEHRLFGAFNRRQLLWGGAGAMAASLGGLVIGAVLAARTTHYVAKRGEVRMVALPDGSVMTLDSATSVAVKFSEHTRELKLIDGEALFDVAKNASRPFIVFAGDTKIRAVGTSFSVRRIAGHPTTVLVREGVVEVTPIFRTILATSSIPHPPVVTVANQMVVASTDAPIVAQTLSPGDLSDALAWKDGMIAFKRTPLRVAAKSFARYSNTAIVIDDPVVGDLTVTGLFSAYNPTGFAQAAAASLDLHAQVQDGSVRLSQ